MSYDGQERRASDGRITDIEHEIHAIRELMQEDREDRKEFRKKFDLMLFGDGDQKKGLVTRTVELENAQRIHAKFAWTAISVAMGLAITSIWKIFTGSIK